MLSKSTFAELINCNYCTVAIDKKQAKGGKYDKER